VAEAEVADARALLARPVARRRQPGVADEALRLVAALSLGWPRADRRIPTA
jgi:hypothetical protein